MESLKKLRKSLKNETPEILRFINRWKRDMIIMTGMI